MDFDERQKEIDMDRLVARDIYNQATEGHTINPATIMERAKAIWSHCRRRQHQLNMERQEEIDYVDTI